MATKIKEQNNQVGETEMDGRFLVVEQPACTDYKTNPEAIQPGDKPKNWIRGGLVNA